MTNPLQTYWQDLDKTQRRWLSAGIIIVALMLYWALFWDPLADARQALSRQLSNERANALWLQQLHPQTQQQAGASRQLPAGKTLLRLVDETLRAQGMAAGIERIEPGDDGEVRLWLRGVAFDQLSIWLALMSNRYGVLSTQAAINRDANAAGLVNVRLDLQAS